MPDGVVFTLEAPGAGRVTTACKSGPASVETMLDEQDGLILNIGIANGGTWNTIVAVLGHASARVGRRGIAVECP